MINFSIFICTRERISLLTKSLKSLEKNTGNKKNLEIIISLDNDDYKTLAFLKKYKKKSKILIKINSSSRGLGYKKNPERLKNMIKKSSGKFYIYFADDMMINTKNWDLILSNYIKKLPADKLFLVSFKHNQKAIAEWPLCQILTKEWTKLTGKFTNCFETDTELLIISSIIKRYYQMKNIKLFHNIKIRDKTFFDGRSKLLSKKVHSGSIVSIIGFIKILQDIYTIESNIFKKNLFKKIFIFIKVIFYYPIYIMFRFKINLLRNLIL